MFAYPTWQPIRSEDTFDASMTTHVTALDHDAGWLLTLIGVSAVVFVLIRLV